MSDESSADWSNIKSQHQELFVENKKRNFDLNALHPEAQKRLQMLGLLKASDNGQQEEATDEEIDRILRKTEQNEDPNTLADKYMMKHGLYELFKTMTTKVVLNRPADPIQFMVDDLEKQKPDHTKN